MNFKKTAMSVALTSVLGGVISAPAQADIIDMNFNGIFTMLDEVGTGVLNTAKAYYYDTTWDYGKRTNITGTMSFNTDTGYGTSAINSFDFFSNTAIPHDVEFQSIGNGKMLGSMFFQWGTEDIATQIVLDASGLFAALGQGIPPVGSVLDQSFCTATGACALPASDRAFRNSVPIGAVPIATSTFNVAGNDGVNTTLAGLSLGTDDGIGGSPMDNGAFSGFNANFDINSVEVTAVTPSVPVPAAVWLFGSGLIGLVGVARRRKQA